MLGGSLLPQKTDVPPRQDSAVLFDLEMKVALKQMEAKDLNAVVEGITSLIGPQLGRGGTSFHITVEPVLDSCIEDQAKAA